MTFFDFSEKVKTVQEFGICDNKTEKEKPAFIVYENKEDWNAVVVSENSPDFGFIAVDNNIPYKDKTGNEKKRCDAMIWTSNSVVFIELKNQTRDWLDKAIEQLKSTIEHFDNVDGLDKFKFKKAYACNKARPFFNYQFKDRIQQFYNDTGVNLRTEVLIRNIK